MLRIEDLEVYKLSLDLSDKIWNLVTKWAYLKKDIPINIGSKHLIRSIDSVAANLSEGYGRFFYKENKQKMTSFTYLYGKSFSNKFEVLEEFIKIAFLNRKNILDSTFNYLKIVIDSVAANLSERYGRFFYKENKQKMTSFTYLYGKSFSNKF